MALADTARLISSLELEDKFTKTADKFDRTVSGLDRKTKTLSQVGFRIGSGARDAITNIGRIGVVGAGLIASQVALGVKSLVQLEEIKNQTNAVIQSTKGAANVSAEAVRAQAEALEDLSTVDDKVIQAGQNILLTFTNVRNEVGKGNDIFSQATETLLDMSVALGTEPKQAAIQLGKALNDPLKGITALTRVGVTFTDEQKKQIEAMVKAGDTMKAQKVILAELNKEFGGSAEAFGKGPGAAMRRFGDAVEGAQQALATGFLPLIEKVSERVQEALGDPEVLRNIKAFGEEAAKGIDQLIDIGTKLPWDAIGASAKLMGQGAKALLDAFTGLPPWVQTAVLTGWGLNKLTGGALGSIAATLGKSAFGALRGSTPATPVFTKEVGLGGGPGVGGGKGGLLGMLLGGTAAGLAIAGGFSAITDLNKNLEQGKLDLGAIMDTTPSGLIGRAISELLGIGRKPLTIGGGGAATPLGQFDPKNAGGVPVHVTNGGDIVPPGLFESLGLQIRASEKGVRSSLKEGDIHAARLAANHSELLNSMRGTIRGGFNDVIPHLGQTNRALSTANRNLENGNARQRETAQRVAEARDRIGNGFARSNEQLGIIASKDFSPNVAVNVTANTSVSISEVTRAAVSNSFASGFTPGLLNG